MIEINEKNENGNLDVAIIGIGLRMPGRSCTPKQLWDNLINGFDGVVETKERWSDSFYSNGEVQTKYAGLIEMDEWISFDPIFFGINPIEAKQIDPQIKLLLKTTWEAFEDSGIDPLSMKGSNTTVYIGASSLDYMFTNIDNNDNLNIFHSAGCSLSNRLSYCYDFRNQSLSIDTACSSSLNAVSLGYQSIVNGKSECSVVGGVNFLLDPNISRSFTSVGVLGKTGKCLTFDEKADGFVRSEGAVVLILKKLSKAIQDGNQIYSVIKGSNSNVDGTLNKTNYFAPSKESQTINVLKAFESTNGNLLKSDIDFFELHGTGTQIGDPTETEAISNIFKEFKSPTNPLLIGSIKSNVGHLEAASGVASLAKVALMFKHRQFVKNINFNTPNPNIKFDEWNIKVCTETVPFPNKKVSIAINSFGITGSNVCLLLTEHIGASSSSSTTPPTPTTPLKNNNNIRYLIPISANSKKSLELNRIKLINDVEENLDQIAFDNFISYQICSKSIKLSQRSVLIGCNWNDIIQSGKRENIGNPDYNISTGNNKSGNIINKEKNPNLVFVFPGQGPQFNKMCVQLYENEPIFKSSVDLIDSCLAKYCGTSIMEALRSIDDNDKLIINQPLIAQPSLFIIQASLFELYKHWGISPSIIIGHSLGEITSAYCSGMIDLETACFIVYTRGLLQNKTIGSGKMMAIGLSEQDYKNQFLNKYPLVEISCFNSQSSIVISGSEIELNEISATLKENEIFSIMLGALSSFHSSKQDILKQDILKSFSNINSSPPKITTFSTVTSNQFDNTETTKFNSNYIFENIRQPVLFQKTIENILKYIDEDSSTTNTIFLELSPNPTLVQYVKEICSNHSGSNSVTILSSLNKKKVDSIEFQRSICELYCNGYNVDFSCQLSRRMVSGEFNKLSYLLPRYQWDESVYFKQNQSCLNYRKLGIPTNQLGLRNELSPFTSFTSYIDIGEEPFQFLKGHQNHQNKYLYPGCGYLDAILKMFPNQDLTVLNLQFKSPLLLKEGYRQMITTTLYSTGKNEFKVIFHYKDEKNGKWIESSNGKISLSKHSDIKKQVDVEKLKQRCNITTIQQKELYQGIKSVAQISLSGSFQSVKEASYGSKSCFAKVSLDSVSSYDVDTFFNICILDACYQVLPILHGQSQSQLYFERVENLCFYSDNIPNFAMDREKFGFIYIYCEYLYSKGDSLYASVSGFLLDGSILFHSPKATFTSAIVLKNEMAIVNPNNELLVPCLQSIESLLQSPLTYSTLINNSTTIDQNVLKKALTTCLFSTLKEKFGSITPEKCLDDQFDQLNCLNVLETDSFGKKNLAKTLFTIFKVNNSLIDLVSLPTLITSLSTQQIENIKNITNVFINSTGPSSSIEIKENQLILDILSTSIKPILNEKVVFRILAIGGFGVLSLNLMNKLNSFLVENPQSEIDIEFTFADNQDSNWKLFKEKLKIYEKTIGLSFLFKKLDLVIGVDSDCLQQNFNPSYYDMVILSSMCNVGVVGVGSNNEDIKRSFKLIQQLTTPCGHLIILDSSYKTDIGDIFENYQQWLYYNYLGNSTKMNLQDWKQLLSTVKFDETTVLNYTNEPFIIQVQKKSISSLISLYTSITAIAQYDQVVIFGGIIDGIDENETTTSIENINLNGTDVYRIFTIEEFEKQVSSKPLTEKSIIISTLGIPDLVPDNYKKITLDYIKVNQYLLKNEIAAKHILCTKSVYFETTNLFASSLIGSFRYFLEFNKLNIYAIDFGKEIIEKVLQYNTLIQDLMNPHKNCQREYVIRENKVYYHRLKLVRNQKLKLKSSSYIDDKSDDLLSRLNPNLEYILQPKLSVLPKQAVEVKVMCTGINFKDYLIYRHLVPLEVMNSKGDYHNPEFGIEMSGIVTRVGDSVTGFKVGDAVYGLSYCSTSSHVITSQDLIALKPTNISFVEAASLPSVYTTSYKSLFITGKLNIYEKEIVLIHTGTGGIGLSCIELLKVSGFNSLLFVTVGTKEKEQYLVEKYGDFITGIYSSRNNDFCQEIKKKISELNGNGSDDIQPIDVTKGVDLIINTLSSEFMDSNFNLLSQGGRIVDLSITHLTGNDSIDFNKFKYSIGYTTLSFTDLHFSMIFNIINQMIIRGDIKPMPIKEYQVANIKDAFEYIGQSKHIGKIVVNHLSPNDLVLDAMKLSKDQHPNQYIISSPNYKIDENSLGKTVLITGQTGLSLTIIKWILQYSKTVENIIILSKSPIKYELELLIGIEKQKKGSTIKFHFRICNVGNMMELIGCVDEIYETNKDLNLQLVESIFHNAFSPSFCDPLDIDMNHLEESFNAKVDCAVTLNFLSMWKWTVKNFVIASSVTSETGSQRQCGYVAANNIINSIVRFRKLYGLPSASIMWGVLGETGYTSRNESSSQLFESLGVNKISNDLIIGSLDLLLQNTDSLSNVMVSSFDYKLFGSYCNGNKNLLKFDYLFNPLVTDSNNKSLVQDDQFVIELEILNKFSEFLSIDSSRLNLDIKMVDLGADSLGIVEIKNWLDKTYTRDILSISQIQDSTINKIIQSVKLTSSTKSTLSSTTLPTETSTTFSMEKETINWVKELTLDPSIRPTDEIIKLYNDDSMGTTTISNLSYLLTGSTGFLGIYILYNLLLNVNVKYVYCLSRSYSKQDGLNKIIDLFKQYQINDGITIGQLSKIQIVLGDYTLDKMGITSLEEYTTLSNSIDIVINCAASTNYHLNYQAMKSQNITGVDQCIIFSSIGKLKKLIQISSMAIYSNSSIRNIDDKFLNEYNFIDDISDPTFIKDQDNIFIGYSQSKIVSEYHIKEAALRGIPCTIIRPPFLFSDSITGISKNDDLMQTLIQSSYVMGIYPSDNYQRSYVIPVSWCAKNISFLSTLPSPPQDSKSQIDNLTCYNLFGESFKLVESLESFSNSLVEPLKPVTLAQFFKKLLTFGHPSTESLSFFIKNDNFLNLIFQQGFYKMSDDIFIGGDYKINEQLKSLLQSNNSYNGWELTNEAIKNHCSYVFKKKIL